MQSKLPFGYLLIPLLYLMIIAALLYGHFGGATRIHTNSGSIGISAIIPAGVSGEYRRPSSLTLGYDGFSVEFDSSASIRTSDGSTRSVDLLDFEIGDSEVLVRFEAGITVTATDPGAGRLLITASSSEASTTHLTIPLSVQASHPDLRVPYFVVGSHYLFAPLGSRLAASDKEMEIPIMNQPATLAIAPSPRGGDSRPPLSSWLEERYDFVDTATVERRIDSFLDAIYAGWTTGRYRSAQSGWVAADGTEAFDERIFAPLVAETLARGSFRTLYPRILEISRIHRSELTYRSAPLLGNIVAMSSTIDAEDQGRTETIRTALQQDDPGLFAREPADKLVPFVLDRAPYAMAGELVALALGIESETVTPEIAVGAVSYLNEIRRFDPELVGSDQIVLERFVDLVLPFLSIDQVGITLASTRITGEPESDRRDIAVEATIRGGVLLEEIAADNAVFRSIGLQLIHTGLSAADSNGFIASKLDSSATPGTSPAPIAPERVYRLLTDNPYVPREISLLRELGPGSWMWSAAGNVSVDADDQTITLAFDFPVGAAHHLILRGLGGFSSIRLFGIPWKQDPLFQNYTSGYSYNPATDTLFLKLTHRQIREQIVIQR